jgi:hypothetical protein
MSNLFLDEGEKACGQKVLLATTAYETTSPGYVYSIQKTRMALEKAGIQTAYLLLSGNCHVDDARNVVVQNFLLTDCTDLIFIDADVFWNPDSLIKLAQADADLVGGIYPYRREGQNEKLPVIPMPGIREPDENGLQEVIGLPTGFMKIRRNVIEKLCEDADHFYNRAETRSRVPILFERIFEDDARWGGDINFCRKWHRKGGKVYALPDLRLGHTGSLTIYDSMAAATRRQDKQTLKYMAEKVKNNDFNPYLFAEVLKAEGNTYSALEDVLMMCALLGHKADGPIIETGSGITSIVLAASTDQSVFCLEHDDYWADKVRDMAIEAEVDNLHVVKCDIEDNWYKLPEGLPERFSVGLNDGPSRLVGDRMGFFDHFGDTNSIIVDDADDIGYGDALKAWCAANDRKIDFIERSALIRG